MQIHVCTVEGAAQTNLSAVVPFWIAEEKGAINKKDKKVTCVTYLKK